MTAATDARAERRDRDNESGSRRNATSIVSVDEWWPAEWRGSSTVPTWPIVGARSNDSSQRGHRQLSDSVTGISQRRRMTHIASDVPHASHSSMRPLTQNVRCAPDLHGARCQCHSPINRTPPLVCLSLQAIDIVTSSPAAFDPCPKRLPLLSVALPLSTSHDAVCLLQRCGAAVQR